VAYAPTMAAALSGATVPQLRHWRSPRIELARHPGQMLLAAMAEVIGPFPIRPGVGIPDLLKPRTHLSVDPETQGDFPVIAGTRVPYDAVAASCARTWRLRRSLTTTRPYRPKPHVTRSTSRST
jgi:hypothetical protein